MKSKCKHHNCEAVKYGISDDVAVPDKDGKITLLLNGNEISHVPWMVGNCLDCITVIVENEGYFSETPPDDYMDANQLNQGWGYY